MRWKPFGDWIFLVNAFKILPKVEFAVLRDFRWPPPQKYVSMVGWTCYDFGWFRFYYWPMGVDAGKAERDKVFAEVFKDSDDEYEY